MYVINDIAYAGESETPIRVKSVRPLEGFRLWIRFTNSEEKIFDFTSLLEVPCYLPLKDKSLFDRVYVDYGCTVWDDGNIDIAPERLYEQGVSVNNIIVDMVK